MLITEKKILLAEDEQGVRAIRAEPRLPRHQPAVGPPSRLLPAQVDVGVYGREEVAVRGSEDSRTGAVVFGCDGKLEHDGEL